MGTVRFLLALWVVVAHSHGSTLMGLTLFSGTTAVQCFYVISGFLITMILNERKEYRSLSNFYISRYLRLWPVYILIAITALLTVKWHWFASVLPATASPSAIAFIAFSNLTLFLQDWFLFLKFDGSALDFALNFRTGPTPAPYYFLLVPQCWSLGIELTFYAIAPFCCRHWWRLSLLFAFGLLCRLYTGSLGLTFDPWTYRFAPSEMMLFAAGGLAYLAGRRAYALSPDAVRIAGFASLAGFVALTVGARIVSPGLPDHETYFSQTLMLYNPQVLLFTILAAAPLFYATRGNRIDSFIGELSYPMYVTHILIGELLPRWASPWMLQGNALYVAVVILVSVAILYFITIPLDRYRQRFGALSIAAPPVGTYQPRNAA
jgi:peptidoglycan/LPS O-acetylase OafA/YrhL